MKKHKPLIIAAISWLMLSLVIFLTDPFEAPLVILILPFALLFVSLYQLMMYLAQRLLPNMSAVRRKAAIIPLSLLPVVLLLLSSVQQLTTRDIVLIAVLLIVTGFYIRKSHIFNQ